MGLDMYLYGVKQEFEKHDYNIGGYKECIEIGYWRKANAIHKWFVDTCQYGEDNCAIYYVGHEDLKALKELCENVLLEPKRAEKLLPTQSGFFFGPTDFDEFYFQNLKDTVEICEWALAQNFDYFEYHSSW